MGARYRKLYLQSLADGTPRFWVAPPPNVFGADVSETVVNALLSGAGTALLSGSVMYLVTGRVDIPACMSWSGIAGGIVIVAPIAGEIISEVAGDVAESIARGWENGRTPEPEPMQVAPIDDRIVKDEPEQSRVEGEWWYKTSSGRLCCYPTPRDAHRKPQISDARMRAIFVLAMAGTPFSEREMVEKVSGLSGPRFRILKQDWRVRSLYVMLPDKSGYFTAMGKLIAGVIANYNPPAPV